MNMWHENLTFHLHISNDNCNAILDRGRNSEVYQQPFLERLSTAARKRAINVKRKPIQKSLTTYLSKANQNKIIIQDMNIVVYNIFSFIIRLMIQNIRF